MPSLIENISNLSSAIRNKINTIMPRLIPDGGSSGQVLVKTTNDDYAVSWTSIDSGWGAITTIATGSEQDIILPEDGLSATDVILFVGGVFQHTGYTISGNILTTIQPNGFQIQVLRYGVGPTGPQGEKGNSKYSEIIGDGLASEITISHQLNTKDIIVSVRDAASNSSISSYNWTAVSNNQVTIIFSTPPYENQYVATVIG